MGPTCNTLTLTTADGLDMLDLQVVHGPDRLCPVN